MHLLGGRDGMRGIIEDGVGSVADALEDASAVAFHHLAHDGVVAHEGLGALLAMAVGQARAVLDVGEEEGQRTLGG
jgi:hypothetical protein